MELNDYRVHVNNEFDAMGEVRKVLVVALIVIIIGTLTYLGYRWDNSRKAAEAVETMYAQIEHPLSITDEQIAEANSYLESADLDDETKRKVAELTYAVNRARLAEYTSVESSAEITYQDGKIRDGDVTIDDNAFQWDGDKTVIYNLGPTSVAPLATLAETGEPISSEPNDPCEGPVD